MARLRLTLVMLAVVIGASVGMAVIVAAPSTAADTSARSVTHAYDLANNHASEPRSGHLGQQSR
jgi:hypothetical protein